jgi:predicted metal-dependent phosphoesterase TrpH
VSAAAPRRRHTVSPELGRDAPPATVDLHVHSRRSDGLLEPAELVAAATAAGVRLLALTDHDTLHGYREVVAAGAVPAGLELLAGVEINAVVGARARTWEGELHVLGFGLDPDNDELESVLATQRQSRRVRFERMLARLRELDLGVDDVLEAEEAGIATGVASLGRPTIARALIAKGHASSVEDAFDRLLSRGRPAHIARDGLDPIEAIAVIRRAGGLPALAHYPEAPARESTVRELQTAGLGGLEVYYRTFDRPTVDAMAAFAARLGLVPSGGTDYHGDLGSYAGSHAGLWFPAEAAIPLRRALGLRMELGVEVVT